MQIDLPPIIEIEVESDYPEPGNYRKRVVQPKITWGNRLIWTGTVREVTTWDGEAEERAAQREAEDHMVERLRRLFE